MRDRRFIAEHRGGLMNQAQHRQLMLWACTCTEHVLPLCGPKCDQRLVNAISLAKAWVNGNASVGEARKASLEAIAAAKEFDDPAAIAVARSAGHAVATAHMADHSLGAALYALKAVKSAGKSIEAERAWQNEQLSEELRGLVLQARIIKEKSLHIPSS
jgi:hypothetical protein